MDIFDIWVNLVTEQSAQQFVTQEGYENIPGYLGSNEGPLGVDTLLAIMDELGVATGVFTGGLDRNTDKLLDICDAHPAASSSPAASAIRRDPAGRSSALRELAQHPRVLHGARHAARVAGADERRAPLPDLPSVRGARDPGRHQRRHPRAAGAFARAAPGAARGRADRLPRSHGDRRAHGPSLRRAAHELHAQVVEPLRLVHRVRAHATWTRTSSRS